MRAWKWMALVAAGGLLLQLGSCAVQLVYLVLQGVATQIASGLVQQALSNGTTATGA